MALSIDPLKFSKYVTRAGGGLAQDFDRRGMVIVAKARQLSSGVLVNVRTGRLRAGYDHEVRPDQGAGKSMVLRVGSDVEYLIHLEHGTRYIRPRHILKTALRSTNGGKG